MNRLINYLSTVMMFAVVAVLTCSMTNRGGGCLLFIFVFIVPFYIISLMRTETGRWRGGGGCVVLTRLRM